MDLDFWDYFGRENNCLITEEIQYKYVDQSCIIIKILIGVFSSKTIPKIWISLTRQIHIFEIVLEANKPCLMSEELQQPS